MFDSTHILKDSSLVTASGNGSVDGSAKVVNLGNGLVRGNMHIDITRIDINDNDEIYRLHLMGGSDSSFTNEVSLCELELGAKEVVEGNQDNLISRFVLPFQNEQAGVVYPHVRVRHEIAGTSPKLNYSARLEPDLPFRGSTHITADSTTTTTTT